MDNQTKGPQKKPYSSAAWSTGLVALPGTWQGPLAESDDLWKGVSPDAQKHIQRSMRSLEKGAAHAPTFKLGGRDDVSLATDFIDRYIKPRNDVPTWQYEYELSRCSKWGPQGGYAPWDEVRDNFLLYYERPEYVNLSPDETRLVERVQAKYSELNAHKMKLDGTLAHLVASDKIKERASGWREFDRKKTDPVAMSVALADAASGFWKHGWGYVFERYNKLKKRIFFPMPYSDMLLEAQYYTPFLEAIQEDLRTRGHHSPFTFWADKLGFDPMFKDIVSPLCRSMHVNFDHLVFVQRDFEKMDTTSGFQQTKNFFLPSLARGLNISQGTQEWKQLHDLLAFGAQCPILTPDGVYVGARGKASGAETTNGDETCGNECFDAIMFEELTRLCAERNIMFRRIYSGGNGDDGLSIYELYNTEDLPAFRKCVAISAETAGSHCGYRVQGEKFTVDLGHGLYCQQMIAPRGNEIWNAYPAALILNSIVNPENQYPKSAWDKDYRDLDIIGKLDNGRNLQYFIPLINYVDLRMKYRLLGRSEVELRRIVSKWEAWKALRYDNFNVRSDAYNDITKSPTLRYLLAHRGHSLR
jgi:hypothetical protein